MSQFSNDLRHAVRSWWRSPGVFAVSVLSLGLGLGVATTILTVLDGLLFAETRGLEDPDRLVRVYTGEAGSDRPHGPSSFPDFLDLAASLDALESVTVSRAEPATFGDGPADKVVMAEEVGWGYFETLGIRPARGRAFSPADAGGDSEQLAVVGHRLWVRELGGDPSILGRSIRIGGHLHEVVGIAPEGLAMGNPLVATEVWIPLTPGSRAAELAGQRELRRYTIHGRLAAGATLERLRAQLEVAADRLHRDHGSSFESSTGRPLELRALAEQDARIPPERRRILLAVALFPLLIAGLVLVIAASNVATLFLARAETRRRATALRVALGAPRSRLVSLFLVESLLPGLAGAAVGLALAWGALRVLATARLPVAVPISLSFPIGFDVALAAFALAVGVSVAFGMLPVLGERVDLARTLRGSSVGAGGRPGAGRWRRALVVVQIAAAVVLLTGAGLLLRGARNAQVIDLGFDPEGIALTSKELPAGPDDEATSLARIDELLDRLRSLPEVTEAHASTAVEMSLAGLLETPVSPGALSAGSAETLVAFRNDVTPGYLETLGIRLLRGRGLVDADGPDAARVAVVNDVFAARLWPEDEPVGASFEAAVATDTGSTTHRFTVVGIVRDGKFRDIDDPPLPCFWTSLRQVEAPGRVVLTVRGRGEAGPLVPILRREVPRAEGEVVRLPPATLSSSVDLQLWFGRMAVDVLGWGGAFGLLLAGLGLHGIVAFSVACRRREIAIRMAVGAERRDVVGGVVGEGLRLSLLGCAIGLLAAVPLAHLLRARLFGISPADPLVLGATVVVLVGIALSSSLVPARRALAVDPAGVLRAE